MLSAFLLALAAAETSPRFVVRMAPEARATPASGRLVVLLVNAESKIGARREPVDGPFFEDPQPLYGIDAELAPGESATIDDAATSFPVKLSELPAGKWRAQARFDLVRADSEWRREAGNLYSKPVEFDVPRAYGAGPLELVLDQVVVVPPPKVVEGVEWFEVRSELLSKFRGHDVMLRAGIALPLGFDKARKYAAIYEVPGFGGNHQGVGPRRASKSDATSAKAVLARETFQIVLDPEGPNGHTLFADSDNNGPCGAALVRELIPALEKRFLLIAQPSARLLRGHSSGGWSTLWLALTYPDVFGATWSSSPDPVDFHRFQHIDLHGDENFFVRDGLEIPSYRTGGVVRMSVRQENGGEEVLGPDNTSAQQWDSWFAVYGPRNERGNPAAVYDVSTGRIERAVAALYRRCDVTALVRAEPARYAPLLRDRVRLVVGDQDNFYLNEAVELLVRELQQQKIALGSGYVTIVPGVDHGSIFGSAEIKRFPEEMLTHLRAHGHVK